MAEHAPLVCMSMAPSTPVEIAGVEIWVYLANKLRSGAVGYLSAYGMTSKIHSCSELGR